MDIKSQFSMSEFTKPTHNADNFTAVSQPFNHSEIQLNTDYIFLLIS